MMISNAERLPVTILTGFLGSGKTTVLNRLLKLPGLADTAVIVNEFGEVGLDHLLIEQAFENAVLLKNGCICCTVRGDIADTLATLWARVESGEIPPFSRVVIETTGLADPAPVAHTLVSEIDAGYSCRLDGIVTTVDAVHVLGQIERQEEARNQIAMADRVLLTKSDMVSTAQNAAVERAVRKLNAHAPMRVVVHGEVTPEDIFGLGPDPDATDDRLTRWLAGPGSHHDEHFGHHHGIGSCVVTTAKPVRLDAIGFWLDSILSLRGADVLRLKGMVHVEGDKRLMVLQGVHHVLHPPLWLEPRAEFSTKTEIVLITRGMSAQGLQNSFSACMDQ